MKNLTLLFTLLITVNCLGQVPSYVPTDSLVGWWPFNGNANDESGNGNDGTVNGAVLTSDRFGNSNAAYDFDGVDDYVQVSSSSSIQLPNTFSISCWVVVNDSTEKYGFVEKGANQNRNFRLSTNDTLAQTGQVFFFWEESGANHGATSNSYLQANSWYNITAVYDGFKSQLFINGLLESEINEIAVPDIDNEDLFFGVFGEWMAYFLDGQLDDIGIWNRALDSTEIQQLYTASQNPCCGNYSLEFDGVDDYVELGTIAPFNASESISLETYFKWDGSNNITNHQYILLFAQNGPGNAALTINNDGVLKTSVLQCNCQADTDEYLYTDTLQQGIWYHILFSYNTSNGDLRLYLDGALVDQGNYTFTSYYNVNNTPSRIGNYHFNEYHFKGNIHMAKIVNAVIAPDSNCLISATHPSTIGYWNIEEGSGTTTADQTSNGNDGTLMNGVLWSTDVPPCDTTLGDTCTYYDTVTVMVYDTTYVTVNDTVIYYDTVLVSVTDTLIIDVTLTGVAPPNNMNTLKVYPNPANDVVIINNGDYATMTNYTIKIVNDLGQEIFNSIVNAQEFQIPVSTFGAEGLYYIQIFDDNNTLLETKKLVLN